MFKFNVATKRGFLLTTLQSSAPNFVGSKPRITQLSWKVFYLSSQDTCSTFFLAGHEVSIALFALYPGEQASRGDQHINGVMSTLN